MNLFQHAQEFHFCPAPSSPVYLHLILRHFASRCLRWNMASFSHPMHLWLHCWWPIIKNDSFLCRARCVRTYVTWRNWCEHRFLIVENRDRMHAHLKIGNFFKDKIKLHWIVCPSIDSKKSFKKHWILRNDVKRRWNNKSHVFCVQSSLEKQSSKTRIPYMYWTSVYPLETF